MRNASPTTVRSPGARVGLLVMAVLLLLPVAGAPGARAEDGGAITLAEIRAALSEALSDPSAMRGLSGRLEALVRGREIRQEMDVTLAESRRPTETDPGALTTAVPEEQDHGVLRVLHPYPTLTWRDLASGEYEACARVTNAGRTIVRYPVESVHVERDEKDRPQLVVMAGRLTLPEIEAALGGRMRGSLLTLEAERRNLARARFRWLGQEMPKEFPYDQSGGPAFGQATLSTMTLPGADDALLQSLRELEGLSIRIGGQDPLRPQPFEGTFSVLQGGAIPPYLGGRRSTIERILDLRIVLDYLATEYWAEDPDEATSFQQPLLVWICESPERVAAWNDLQETEITPAPTYRAEASSSAGPHDVLRPYEPPTPRIPRVAWRSDPLGLLPARLPERPKDTLFGYDDPWSGPPFDQAMNLGRSDVYRAFTKHFAPTWTWAQQRIWAIPTVEREARRRLAALREGLDAEWSWIEAEVMRLRAVSPANYLAWRAEMVAKGKRR